MQTVEPAVVTTRHPLDPLTADEVLAASSILKKERGLDAGHRFVYVMLNEPAKKEVLAWKPGNGSQVDRQAFIVLRDRPNRKTIEAVVSLTQEKVVSWKEIEGVQASIMLEEFLTVDEVVRKDPRWQEALRKRGVTDFEMAITDALTGLFNRRYMETHLAGLVEQAAARSKPIAVLVLDIDYFKSINDGHGHDAGDRHHRRHVRPPDARRGA